MAAVERGKAVIVGVNGKKFSALDHDFTKCSVTPSVTMFCHIPEDIDDTFYSGNVYLELKIPSWSLLQLIDMQPSSLNLYLFVAMLNL